MFGVIVVVLRLASHSLVTILPSACRCCQLACLSRRPHFNHLSLKNLGSSKGPTNRYPAHSTPASTVASWSWVLHFYLDVVCKKTFAAQWASQDRGSKPQQDDHIAIAIERCTNTISRSRRKLDHDPNNTRWTRDETTFGQKILRAQGWQPGKFLGAQDTAHAQLHSVASLAPIKINLKDDTLGLGAKIRQKQSDECTGLDVFKDLLGRLNGKSEEALEKERQVRSEIKTNLVVERKYGPMRFVSGGLLVGDHMMAELVDKKPTSTPVKEESVSETSEDESVKKQKKEKKDKKSKKRKASESEEADTSDGKHEKKRKKRSKVDEESKDDSIGIEKPEKKRKDKEKKKSKRSRTEPEEEDDAGPIESEVKRKKSKKSQNGLQDSRPDTSAESSEDNVSKKARKKEKKKEKSGNRQTAQRLA